ncbi:hypothetical protein WJX77_012659 [Trebouxia sp. C0004]
MASQIVKTPAVGTPLTQLRQNFQPCRISSSQHSRESCACRLSAARAEITTTDKAFTGAAAAFLSLGLFACQPASADLNRFEAAAGGEFGVGTAAQFGEAELRGKDFSGQDLRRSNFTSADARNASFKGAKLQGAYFIKAVTANANFEDADLSDVLFDRAVLNGANLKNANLSRTIFTRTDFGGANITGADFTNALVDKSQQIAMCRYADGVNAETGVDTRTSLGCGSRRKFREASPSSSEGPQVTESQKKDFVKSMPVYRQ